MRKLVCAFFLISAIAAVNASWLLQDEQTFIDCSQKVWPEAFTAIVRKIIKGVRVCLTDEPNYIRDNAMNTLQYIMYEKDNYEDDYRQEEDTVEKYQKLYAYALTTYDNNEKVRRLASNLRAETKKCIDKTIKEEEEVIEKVLKCKSQSNFHNESDF